MKNIKLNLEAPWEEVKEMIQEVNVYITDEDLAYEEGKELDLLDRLAAKLHMTRQRVKDFIESISYNRGIAG